MKPRQRALLEIMKFQKSIDSLIPKAPFTRLVKEILYSYKDDARISIQALACLQEGAKQALVSPFEDTQLCVIHAKRITILDRDIRIAKKMKLYIVCSCM